jgi:curli biogenesis system outer membrane secretion channel CsgG
MMRKMGQWLGVSVLVCGLLAANGCAMMDQLTKTVTSDGDAKMGLGEYKGVKHAIGCKDFQNQAGWHGEWEIGNNLSIMLESALFDTGRFVIVEREKLSDVMAEQDLAASGRTAKAKKVAQTGLIRPARYIGTGAVTVVDEGTSGGAGGISIKGISLGGGKSSATITIIAKLIDTTTSEVIQKKTIVGKAGRVSLDVGVSVHGVGANLGGFKKTPLGEAAQDCINQAAVFFAKAMEKIPFDACVVKVSGNQVIINRGSEFGLEVGKEMVMREEGELMTDPNTGEILGNEEGKLIGKLKIAKIAEKVSYCDITEGEKSPKPGTLVTTP